jgi:hypoxanthine phosphoribosyltransferase
LIKSHNSKLEFYKLNVKNYIKFISIKDYLNCLEKIINWKINMTITKTYITADELLLDSFRLGVQIHNSGFKPDFIVGVWRGGTPVGIAIQEILAYLGNESDHIAIRTSSYYGINEQTKEVRVHGIDYLISNMNAEDKLLIVDDVFDSGRSIRAILDTLNERSRKNIPHDIRMAMPWYKPLRNIIDTVPDYFIHETDDWLVFPHEMDGLTEKEIFANKKNMKEILSHVK